MGTTRQPETMGTEPSKEPRLATDRDHTETIERVRRALDGLSYGSVEITVHDGRVVQIERKERVRFNAGHSKS